jgi:hypothetical protein
VAEPLHASGGVVSTNPVSPICLRPISPNGEEAHAATLLPMSGALIAQLRQVAPT